MSQIYKPAPAGSGSGIIQTIAGDSGSITGANVTIFSNNASLNSGSSVSFVNSGTVSTLNVTDANVNTMIGRGAGNLSGTFTTTVAVGSLAGQSLTNADSCALFGTSAGQLLTSGSQNTFIGSSCGSNCDTGSSNTGVGQECLVNITSGALNAGSNTAIGANSLDLINTGVSNIAVGAASGSNLTGSNSSNICIGNRGVNGNNNTIRIGTQGSGVGQQNACFLAGVAGVTVANQQQVVVNTSTGQLGSISPIYFQAYLSVNQAATAGSTSETIIFDTTIINSGSAYDTASGIFTAPSTGFYCFSAVVFFDDLTSAIGISETILGYTGSVQSLRLVQQGIGAASAADRIIFNASWSMPMTAGDTVKIQPFTDGTGSYTIAGGGASSTPFNTSSTFSGFKVA